MVSFAKAGGASSTSVLGRYWIDTGGGLRGGSGTKTALIYWCDCGVMLEMLMLVRALTGSYSCVVCTLSHSMNSVKLISIPILVTHAAMRS